MCVCFYCIFRVHWINLYWSVYTFVCIQCTWKFFFILGCFSFIRVNNFSKKEWFFGCKALALCWRAYPFSPCFSLWLCMCICWVSLKRLYLYSNQSRNCWIGRGCQHRLRRIVLLRKFFIFFLSTIFFLKKDTYWNTKSIIVQKNYEVISLKIFSPIPSFFFLFIVFFNIFWFSFFLFSYRISKRKIWFRSFLHQDQDCLFFNFFYFFNTLWLLH
jgi:hypothetical protein